VSNPPYIPHADIEKLEKKVRAFEPLTALDGGADGLDFYRYISKNAPLKDGGLLAFEVGINQAEAVAALMEERFSDIIITKDLSGIDRVVTGRLKPF
jgi:release factor glutamine methyltransferase